MQRRPRLPVPVISVEQRKVLEQWTRRSTSAQALALRARIVLRLGDGHSSTAVAQHFRVHIQTVSKWRERFRSRGVDGLLDEPRPGQPRKITDAQIEAVITRTLENKPTDATHWSTRSMAKAASLNQTAISRIWRAFALQPHRTESFKLSRDPLFYDNVRDLVGLDRTRPTAPWCCVSMKRARSKPWSHRAPSAPAPGTGRVRADDDLAMATPRCLPLWMLRPAR